MYIPYKNAFRVMSKEGGYKRWRKGAICHLLLLRALDLEIEIK
jgi:hypothetical protein